MKKYFIYALTAVVNSTKVVFYIGQTVDPDRRLSEHKRDSKTGSEDKYKYIRMILEPQGIAWSMEILHEITDDQIDADVTLDDYEDYEIVRHYHDDHPLQNMRAGSVLRRAELESLTKSIFTLDSPRAVRDHKNWLAEQRAKEAIKSIHPKAAAALDRIDALTKQIQTDHKVQAEAKRLKAEKRKQRQDKNAQERAKWIAEQEAKWAQQHGKTVSD